MQNITVLVGEKIISADQIDLIDQLDFALLPVVDIQSVLEDTEPDLLIPVVTSDDLTDLITYDEMKIPLFPVILGDQIIHHVEPSVIIDEIKDLKDVTPVPVDQLPKEGF